MARRHNPESENPYSDVLQKYRLMKDALDLASQTSAITSSGMFKRQNAVLAASINDNVLIMLSTISQAVGMSDSYGSPLVVKTVSEEIEGLREELHRAQDAE